jgi:hypothetical protein
MSVVLHWGCPQNPYVIGEVFPGPQDRADAGADVDSGPTDAGVIRGEAFVAPLSISGVSQWPRRLDPWGVPAELVYRGEGAGAAAWPAELGPPLMRSSAAGVSLAAEAPFTDGTRAVHFLTSGPHYSAQQAEVAAFGQDSVVLELIFRAKGPQVILQKPGAYRVELAGTDEEFLIASFEDGVRTIEVRSPALGHDAWHACWLFWDRADATAELHCNGQVGPTTPLAGFGPLPTGAALTLGDPGSDAALSLAYLALYRSPTGLGPAADRLALSQRRFFALTGVLPEWARGSPLPLPEIRSSVAFLDLARDPSGPRHLHRVGPHWPRLSCRPDADGALGCGFLSEGGRRVWLNALSPEEWDARGVNVRADPRPFLDEEPSWRVLTVDSSSRSHTLEHAQDGASDRYSYSVFVRAEVSPQVGLSIDGLGMARYDLAQHRVEAPTSVTAALEDWGAGTWRCIYVADLGGGTHTFRVHALSPSGQEIWSGPTDALLLSGLEVLPNRSYPANPLPGDSQAPDRLSFQATSGNLPEGESAELRFRALHPAAQRRNDGTLLKLDREGNNDQLNVFITAGGDLQSFGIREGDSRFGFGFDALTLADRRWHEVRVRWGQGVVTLTVDGIAEAHDRLDTTNLHQGLERLLVGQGTGHFEGLLQGVSITP